MSSEIEVKIPVESFEPLEAKLNWPIQCTGFIRQEDIYFDNGQLIANDYFMRLRTVTNSFDEWCGQARSAHYLIIKGPTPASVM